MQKKKAEGQKNPEGLIRISDPYFMAVHLDAVISIGPQTQKSKLA